MVKYMAYELISHVWQKTKLVQTKWIAIERGIDIRKAKKYVDLTNRILSIH